VISAKLRDNGLPPSGHARVGTGEEEISETTTQSEFGYAGLREESENSQSATGLDWGRRLVGYHTCACLHGGGYCCFSWELD